MYRKFERGANRISAGFPHRAIHLPRGRQAANRHLGTVRTNHSVYCGGRSLDNRQPPSPLCNNLFNLAGGTMKHRQPHRILGQQRQHCAGAAVDTANAFSDPWFRVEALSIASFRIAGHRTCSAGDGV